MERVRTLWLTLKQQPHESSFAFRKRVEDYQLERASVGLPEIPDEELVIGILNRLDMSRYAALVKESVSTQWKEIKDTQVIRFRGTVNNNLHGVYLSRADDAPDKGRGRGRTARGGRSGRGRGRGRDSPVATITPSTPDPIRPADIVCWTCGKKGHRSTTCPSKTMHFADSAVDVGVYFTTIEDFTPAAEDVSPECHESNKIVSVLLSMTAKSNSTTFLLDTQSSINLICNSDLMINIHDSYHPITVQGITKSRTRVAK
jgi:Zinc knuckle